MQNLGGQTKSIMVFSEVAYSTLLKRTHYTIFQKHSYTRSQYIIYSVVQNLCMLFYTGQHRSHVSQIYNTHSLHSIVAIIQFPTQEENWLKCQSLIYRPVHAAYESLDPISTN